MIGAPPPGDQVTPESEQDPNLNLVTEPMQQQEAPDEPEAVLISAPPPGSPADRRAEVARWIVTWTEPLIDDSSRLRTSREMGRFIERNSDWSCAFLAGVLTDLAHSLPADDPWRHMAALIDLDQVATGRAAEDPNRRLARRSERAPLPALTGAVTVEGRPFGTRKDALDLLSPGVADASVDVGMAAVATNLSPLAAALVAFGAHDARTLQYVLNQTYHHLWMANFASLIDQSAGQALLDASGAAIRWLIHRRRAYTGPEDPFPNMVGFNWISVADRVNAGTPILDEAGRLAKQGAIDAEMYGYLTGADLEADDTGDDF